MARQGYDVAVRWHVDEGITSGRRTELQDNVEERIRVFGGGQDEGGREDLSVRARSSAVRSLHEIIQALMDGQGPGNPAVALPARRQRLVKGLLHLRLVRHDSA